MHSDVSTLLWSLNEYVIQDVTQTQHALEIILLVHNHQPMHPRLSQGFEYRRHSVIHTASVDATKFIWTRTQRVPDGPAEIRVVSRA